MTDAARQPDAETLKWTQMMAALCGTALNPEEKLETLKSVTDDDISGPMLAAAAAYLMDHAQPLEIEGIDVCGTGGDGGKNAVKTFNVSTAVAFVLAAAGVSVVKHGNRGVSSLSGSSDVLAALQVPVATTSAEALAQHAAHGLCFVSAPAFHPALEILAPLRRSLGRPTFLNLLGPLCNPARTTRQLIGVYAARYLQPVAEAAGLLGRTSVLTVHSDDGLDEISISAGSALCCLEQGKVLPLRVTPEDAGLAPAPLEKLQGGSPQQNAAIIHAVFSGTRGPLADIVAVNAGAGLMLAGRAADLKSGYDIAQETLRSGAALKKLVAMKAPRMDTGVDT